MHDEDEPVFTQQMPLTKRIQTMALPIRWLLGPTLLQTSLLRGCEVNLLEGKLFICDPDHEVCVGMSITCAEGFVCRQASPTVYCWGDNFAGQARGDGVAQNEQHTPFQVPGTEDALGVDTGNLFTCVVRNDGGVSCWGAGDLGQLGYGANKSVAFPADVVGIP